MKNLLLKVKKLKSLIPKCEVTDYHRDIDVNIRTNIGLNTLIINVLEGSNNLANMTINRKEYTLEISDSENPTLMSALILGAIEVSGYGGDLEG